MFIWTVPINPHLNGTISLAKATVAVQNLTIAERVRLRKSTATSVH